MTRPVSRIPIFPTLLLLILASCAQPTPTALPPTASATLPPPTATPKPAAPTATPLPPSPTPALAPVVYPTYGDKIGVDLGGVGDRGLEFINVALTLRPWETIHADSCPDGDAACRNAPRDENGWPTTDARTVFFDLRPFGAWWGADQRNCPLCQDGDFQIDVSGTYKLSFNGQAVLTSAEGSVDVRNQVYDEATNVTTADIVVAKGQGLLFVNFVDTRRTPDSPLNTGVTNVRLIRPGFPADATETFAPYFVDALAPFRVLRFMNWVGGNNINPPYDSPNNTLEWSERQLPGELQTEDEGVAWEYVIELANLSGKDIWINIPIHAGDDYVRGLANLLEETLHPDATIYVEYSNEVWNPLFSQYAYNVAAAEAEVAAGGSPLNNDGIDDPEVWAQRRHVKRLVEIGNIFREVFGDDAINHKVRVIHAWQFSLPWQYKSQLQWVEATYGPPSQFFYALAGAAYFNIEQVPNDATLELIFHTLRKSSDASAVGRVALKNVADEYGLKLAMYEGGPDTAGVLQWERNTTLLLSLIAAHRDPRMRDLIIHDMYNNWFAHPQVQGDVFIYFTLQSGYNRWGMWGLTEDVRNLQTPKYQAITDLAGVTRSAPPAPLDVRLSLAEHDVTLNWSPCYGADGYLVKRKKAGGDYQVIAPVAETTFTDPGLDNPPSYFYVVAAVNEQGESDPSSAVGPSLGTAEKPELVPAEIRLAVEPPVIDGEMDAIWNDALAYPLLNVNTGKVDDPRDLKATVYLLYDDAYLYAFYEVEDDALLTDSETVWEDDSVEMYIDGGNEKAKQYDFNDIGLGFELDATNEEQPEGVEFASVRADNGYRVEMRMPWDLVSVKPTPGLVIGFDALVNDDDDGETRDGKLAWFSTQEEAWRDPSTIGVARLTLGPAHAVLVAAPPAIDGVAEPAWEAAPAYDLLNLIGGEAADAADLSARVSLLYDADNLYVLFVVSDDALVHEPTGNAWDDDSAEVYLDGRNEKAAAYDGNDEQYAFAYEGTAPWAQRGRNKGVEYASAPTDAGYIVEIKIPWANVKVTPAGNLRVGFDAHVNDDDDKDSRDGKIALFAVQDQSWTDPSTFGELILLPPPQP